MIACKGDDESHIRAPESSGASCCGANVPSLDQNELGTDQLRVRSGKVWRLVGANGWQFHTKATPNGTDESVYLGVAMVGFGALLAVMAAWHCGVVRKAIERGEIVTNTALVISITIGVVSLAGMMATVMFFTSSSAQP